MKNITKIICIILSLTICFSFSLNVLASNISESTTAKIISALNAVECVKDNMGLSDINFEDIEISDPIHTYEYTSEGFVASRLMYPLKANDTLVALAVAVDISPNTEYQVSTTLISEINAVITEYTSFALVYDYNCCYLFDGTNFSLLKQNTICIEERAVLQTTSTFLSPNIELTNISNSTNLGYISTPQTRTPIYYACSVDYVTQNPYKNLCWAASVACAVNCIKGTNLSAFQVASNYFGSIDCNYGLVPSKITKAINSYSQSYSYKQDTVPSDSVILKNIKANYPILAGFLDSSNRAHMLTLYGINITASYIYLMDPSYGFRSATYKLGVGYQLVRSDINDSIVFKEAICRYWS